jgi:hypothetical protein
MRSAGKIHYVILFCVLYSTQCLAQITCIQKQNDNHSLGIAPSDVENIVAQIATAIGLSPTGITVVPCDGIPKVLSNYYDHDVPQGEYILYDPTWVREVIAAYKRT